MILSFHGSNREKFIKEANEMFRLRARVFAGRLGWSVSVKEGWEIDEFDALNPLYLLALQRGKVCGCLRLLPTTGPTLLSGPLSNMFDDCVDIKSPLILEGTRFAVESDEETAAAGVSHATAELLMAACDVMLEAGLSHMVGVVEERTMRVCRRTGWTPAIIARSRQPAGMLAVLWDVSRQALDGMIARHGFGPVYQNLQEDDRKLAV